MTHKEEIIKPNPRPVRLFFFWAGIIATFAYRIIIFLNFYNPIWVKIAWYIGTVGFALYFWHRSSVQKKRKELVKEYGLEELVDQLPDDEGRRKEALEYLVRTSRTSKSNYNSLFIFWLSAFALVVGIIFDIFKIGH